MSRSEARGRDAVFQPQFIADLRYWSESDSRLNSRLLRIVDEILRDPFRGIGKPEPMRGFADTWSRRLTDEHRIVYRVSAHEVRFLAARHHYR